jgi:plasmid stabilization system protein ParE
LPKPSSGTTACIRVWGEDFLDEIGRSIDLLAHCPDLQPVYYRGFRRVFCRRFPYKLFYRIEGDRVIVFRILHARRDHPRHLSG